MIHEARPALLAFLANPVFLSAVCSLLVAQFMKAVIVLFRPSKRPFREFCVTFFWETGGMPSSHSALAVSIATAIGFTEGIGSSTFILALFFALVVVRDAMGVRRSSGVQAKTLNQVGKELNNRFGIMFRAVKEVQGHNPVQVVAGSLLGFFVALAFCSL